MGEGCGSGKVEGQEPKGVTNLIQKKWQERYFVIDPKSQKIKYYEVVFKNKLVEKGEYKLNSRSSVKSVAENNKPGKKNVILVVGNSRNNIMDDEMMQLYISVPSANLVHNWINAIQSAIKGEDLNAIGEETVSACCENYCVIA